MAARGRRRGACGSRRAQRRGRAGRSSARSWSCSRWSSSPDRLLDLPQPVPRAGSSAATRSSALDNYLELLADPQFWEALRPGRRCSCSSRCRSCSCSRCVAALAIDSGRLYGTGFFRIAIFLPYAVPAVVAALMWGFMYGDQLRPGRRTSTTAFGSDARPTRCRPQLDPRLDRQHRDLGVRRLQHADLLLGARRSSRPTLYEAAEIDGAGQFRVITGDQAARRSAARWSSPRSSRSSAASSSSTSRTSCSTLAPNVDHHLLHAEHVRLQPVLRRPAVQLLRHGRDRHGRDHRGHRLRRPAARHRGRRNDERTVATDPPATAAMPHRRPRRPRRRAGTPPLRPRSRCCTLLMGSSCSTRWCRWSGW